MLPIAYENWPGLILWKCPTAPNSHLLSTENSTSFLLTNRSWEGRFLGMTTISCFTFWEMLALNSLHECHHGCISGCETEGGVVARAETHGRALESVPTSWNWPKLRTCFWSCWLPPDSAGQCWPSSENTNTDVTRCTLTRFTRFQGYNFQFLRCADTLFITPSSKFLLFHCELTSWQQVKQEIEHNIVNPASDTSSRKHSVAGGYGHKKITFEYLHI